ncbi:transposase [Thermodesulfobacteriota bacterium]
MPRQARIDTPNALHHIMIRGIERRKIFRDNKDGDNFTQRLGNIVKETSTSCYAWSLLSNHAHLLLRTGAYPISTVMRRLLTGYAVTFNRRHKRHGQLFQNRYKSILCQEDPYLMELVRYIHLNPLRASIVDNYSMLCRYKYCGHSFIIGKNANDWQDVDYVLGIFSKKRKVAQRNYREYVLKGIKKGHRPELVGGGLIRSFGGWTEARRLVKGGERLKGDERILGDSQFVLDVLKEADERFERKYELKARGYDLDALANRIEELFDMEKGEIYSLGKYKRLIKPRSVFCYWAVRELGETATSLASRLSLTQSGVSKSVLRGEGIVKEMNLKLLND